MKNFSLILLLSCSLLFGGYTSAQEILNRKITVKDGLPSNTVYSICQATDGFMWIGTDAGVSRYDGRRFWNFLLLDGLTDNEILIVEADRFGRVWFLGFNGTVSYWYQNKIYNGSSDSNLTAINKRSLTYGLYKSANGMIWLQGHDGIYQYDSIGISKVQMDVNSQGLFFNQNKKDFLLSEGGIGAVKKTNMVLKKHSLELNLTPPFFIFPKDSVYIASNEGVSRWTENDIKTVIKFDKKLVDTRVPGLLVRNNQIWITITGKGLFCYDLSNLNQPPQIYLKDHIVCVMRADNFGNLWVGTLSEGIYLIPAAANYVHIFNKHNGLEKNNTYSVSGMADGKILVGLNHGVVKYIQDDKVYNYKTLNYDIEQNTVRKMLVKNDDVWIIADGGVIHKNEKLGCNHFIQAAQDKAEPSSFKASKDIRMGPDYVYIANIFGIYRYPIQCPRQAPYVATNCSDLHTRLFSIHYSPSSQIWASSKTGLYNIKDGKKKKYSDGNPILSNRINDINETKDGTLLLGIAGYGLIFFKDGKIMQQLTTLQGLPSDLVISIYVYGDEIYVCTNAGIALIHYKEGKVLGIRNITSGNLIPSNHVKAVNVDNKKLYVATLDGFAIIDKRALEMIISEPPIMNIYEILVNNISTSLKSGVSFSSNQNSFKIKTTGIHFSNPIDVNYRYRLNNNGYWVYTKNPMMEFPYLSPGSYEFQIQTRVQEENWSNIESYSFIILPPFWRTWWFVLGIFSLGILIIILTIYFIVDRQRKRTAFKQESEKQILALEHQALQSLMNPHFVFNVMNSIQHYINDNDKKSANQFLSQFSSLIRMNFNISMKNRISLEEELEYLERYLSLEMLRFGEKLAYEIVIDSEIDKDETVIPVMMIQPFVENAIWHGILPLNSKGLIKIEIKQFDIDLIRVSITDSGIGVDLLKMLNFEPAGKEHGQGVKLIKQRLKLMSDQLQVDFKLTYSNLTEGSGNKGTRVTFLLPSHWY